MWFVFIAALAAPLWIGPPPPQAPQRIVSLAPSATELLFALGAGPQVVGVTRFDDFPEAVKALPKVGGFNDPDTEAVLALHPDCVVAVPTAGGRSRVDALARLGLPVLVVPGQSLADMWETLAALGKAVGHPERAQALRTQLETALQQEQARLQRAHPKPARVLVLLGRRPLVAAGPGSFIDALLSFAAAQNVVTRGGAYPVLDAEALQALAPQVIVDVAMGESTHAQAFWDKTPHPGRVVQVDEAALVRPGPRLFTGLARLRDAVWGG